jgi:low affinity Fe/Cu permease
MATRTIQHTLTALGTLGSRPWAFVTVVVYAAAWLLFQPDSLDMHGIATLMVWMMTLFIQRVEYRDTQATQAKLDELLAAISTARISPTSMKKSLKTLNVAEMRRARVLSI